VRVMRATTVLLLCVSFAAMAPAARANPRSQALVREGYDAVYNLDHDRGIDLFNQAIAADPHDPAAYRAVAAASWLRVLFLRGTVLAEDFLGRVSAQAELKLPPPPDALAKSFRDSIRRAVELGEQSVSKRYRDAGSHYDLGAALGLSASYTGTIDGRVFQGIRQARRAFSEHEFALQIDPGRHDAGLVAGLYRYLIASLPMPVRLMAYVVGFAGDREKAIRLVEEAAAYPSEVQTDAKIALVLLYNREHRYDDALRVSRSLVEAYPRDRLFVLEAGSTAIRAGRFKEAEAILDAGIAKLSTDTRLRMPGEDARWLYQRGMARLRLGSLGDAEQDLRAALARPDVQGWVQGRIHTQLGRIFDLRGDRTKAVREYGTGQSLARAGNDRMAEADATRLLAQPYRQ
jgi:tetratricopeptide (TPR) repeat protein